MFTTPLRDNAELRALEPHHAGEFLAHLDRARAHIAPWVGAGFVAADLDGAQAVLQRYADGRAADRRRLYGIWLDGVLVGGTMFVGFDPALGVCELGCWLEPAAERQGLITLAIGMMIDWAFRVRGLSRAEWPFTTTGGGRPNVEIIREVFIPEGRITSNVGAEPVLYDLDAFIAPRQRILTDGTLTEFSEWEAAERTEIFGSIAHRFSEYRKSGFLDGEWFEGSGHKTIQFIRTPAGWRMSSMAWDDDAP